RASARALQPRWASAFAANKLTFTSAAQSNYLHKLLGTPPKPPSPGEELYVMACLPCHQPEGKGLPGVYPPLIGSDWVRGDATRLIKILLHGLSGPLTVAGQTFGNRPDSIAMPSLGGLTDEQIADVLGYVRNEFGGNAGAVSADEVRRVRALTAGREEPWTTSALAK